MAPKTVNVYTPLPFYCSAADPCKILFPVWVVERLRSGSTDLVIKTVLTYRDRVPAPSCLRAMVMLLSAEDMEIRNAVSEYLDQVVY